MSEPYLSEIKMVSFNFAPKGWAMCNGQVLAIQQYQALFALIGTTYGGDGIHTFALPNLQGRVPIHLGTSNMGNAYVEGEQSGEVNHTLIASEMASHTHPMKATATATTNTAAGNFPAAAGSAIYGSATDTTMNSSIVSQAGGNVAHNNLQPYLVVNFVIAMSGVFPSRS